jgi:formylglycine-generating enzyme required for sulfatase activity
VNGALSGVTAVIALGIALSSLMAAAAAPEPTTLPPRSVPRSFRDCSQCPEMIMIPPGRFAMGTSPEEAIRLGIAPNNRILPWQQPQHAVHIDKPFALGAAPVTRADYAAFAAEAGAQIAGSGWESPGIAQTFRDPVVRVSWRQANAYVAWLTHRAGKPYRLPTEAEWEYAARAGTTTAFWWGDDVGIDHTVCDDCGSEWDGKGTAPVRSFPPNPFGLFDMLGQVFEWTADCWNASYVGAPLDGSAWSSGDCTLHPTRGGSWNLDSRYSRAGSRGRDGDDYEGNMVGLRVARDP